MALSPELEKLLEHVPEAEREGARKALTETYENGLRQDEFSRKMNEQSETHKQNLAWYEKAKGEYDAAIEELRVANEKIATLETSNPNPPNRFSDNRDDEFEDDTKALRAARAEAEAAKAEVAKLSGKLGEIDSMIQEGKLITAEKLNEEVNRRGDAFGAAMFKIWDLQQQHQRDFGTPLDRNVLMEKAAKDHANDLDAAYKSLTEEAATEKLRAEIQAEADKKAEEKFRNSSLPYAPGGDSDLGPLQKIVMNKKDEGSAIPDDVPADGSGRLASLIAQELKTEGKY